MFFYEKANRVYVVHNNSTFQTAKISKVIESAPKKTLYFFPFGGRNSPK